MSKKLEQEILDYITENNQVNMNSVIHKFNDRLHKTFEILCNLLSTKKISRLYSGSKTWYKIN